MTYTVEKTTVDNQPIYVLRDTGTPAEASIAPGGGNTCFSFRKAIQGEWIDIIAPLEDPADLRSGGSHFGYPILFPFPSRIREGRFSFQGKVYHLETTRGRHAIHGFVLNRPWMIVSAEASVDGGASVTSSIEARSFPEVLRQYPFPFRLTVTYTLKDGDLGMTAKAENTGSTAMPMGFGVHPYFPLPLGARGQRADCRLQIPATQYWELEELLPTGRRCDVSGSLDLRSFRPIGDTTYDQVFTGIIVEGGGSSCLLHDPANNLELRVWADAGFREWVVYAPAHRSAVCLEPYTCSADAVNLHYRGIDVGLIVLQPGERWTGHVVISLRSLQ
jgi:aldose 1-epimerase